MFFVLAILGVEPLGRGREGVEGGVGRGKQQNGSVISRGTLGELVPHDQCLYAKEAFTREHWTLNLESGRMRAVNRSVSDRSNAC